MTAIIAFAVYRVQSEQLFVDTFRLRLDALNECIDAAHARVHEICEYDFGGAVTRESGALRRFWDAERAAKPLFGPDFHDALKAVEKGMNAFDTAHILMIESKYADGPKDQRQKNERRTAFLGETYRLIERLSIIAQPYVALGSGGLGLIQRVEIRLRFIWNKIRRRGR